MTRSRLGVKVAEVEEEKDFVEDGREWNCCWGVDSCDGSVDDNNDEDRPEGAETKEPKLLPLLVEWGFAGKESVEVFFKEWE